MQANRNLAVFGPRSDRSVVVPQPPALNLNPTSRRAVVTVAVGESGKAMLAASGSHMKHYATAVGADLVVLDWPGEPSWPMSAKFAIPRTLDHYERIIYADADVLFRPGCVNLFTACAAEEMGVCDELGFHRENCQFGREAAYLRFRAEMGFPSIPILPWMFNAGVMVIPATHKLLLLPPKKPIPTRHCAEQDHTNAQLLASGLPFRLLDRKCNWQFWTDFNFVNAPIDAVLHWSGTGREDRHCRARQIQNYASMHKWPESETASVSRCASKSLR